MKAKNKYQGTETEKNLSAAFASECRARNRYTYFAEEARKSGLIGLAELFNTVANNEWAHAKIWAKEIEAVKDNAFNLQSAIDGENYEYAELYPKCAEVARQEGFNELAKKFELVAEVEKEHEKLFLQYLKDVKNNKVFEKGKVQMWQCSNCGHIVIGKSAPDTCPLCSHPQGYFKIKNS